MDKESVLEALEKLKISAEKREFKQSVDLIIALKDLDFKKPEQQVEMFLSLPHTTGKKTKVCALVGPELIDEAKKVFDLAITQDDFSKYDKRKARKLAGQYDFFIAQANIMTKVAATFGRYLGVRGKMPNPKAGCVVPPKGVNLSVLYDKLQKTMKVSAKKVPLIQLRVGTEEMSQEHIADNIMFIYDQLIHHLPGERHNIKAIFLKYTMSKPIKL
ncbi:50S ribosomal protein L1 [Candidatus Woesearchaeota archaeon]|nr:50S ribosomal protein L1 [Candidatus Woesearchaeota archaeon]